MVGAPRWFGVSLSESGYALAGRRPESSNYISCADFVGCCRPHFVRLPSKCSTATKSQNRCGSYVLDLRSVSNARAKIARPFEVSFR
jgi:hypothetical protein